MLAQEFEVLAVVYSATDLPDALDHLRPDVVVTDIAMPGLSGLDALPTTRLRRPSTRVVMVTVHADRELVERALSLGASGYVVNGDAGDELNSAERASLAGGSYLSAAASGEVRASPARAAGHGRAGSCQSPPDGDAIRQP